MIERLDIHFYLLLYLQENELKIQYYKLINFKNNSNLFNKAFGKIKLEIGLLFTNFFYEIIISFFIM